jgi:hypothetical protein
MGYDLVGHVGASFHVFDWPRVLHIAEVFGWRPEGTVYLDHSDLGIKTPTFQRAMDSYRGNDWQEVTDRDAAALARALNRALDAQPIGKGMKLTAEEVEVVRRLADYAEAGGFVIG